MDDVQGIDKVIFWSKLVVHLLKVELTSHDDVGFVTYESIKENKAFLYVFQSGFFPSTVPDSWKAVKS